MDRFDVEFTSPALSDNDKKNLLDCIRSIGPGHIRFDLFLDKPNIILPLDAINKLLEESVDRTSDINVSVLGEDGAVVSTVVYKRCTFKADLRELLEMSMSSITSFGISFQKSLNVGFDYEKVSLNQKEIV